MAETSFGSFYSSKCPAKSAAPPREKTLGSSIASVLSQLIVPLLTLLGVAVTGILTFSSTVFKENAPPSVGIRVFVGDGILTSSGGNQNATAGSTGATATLPVGQKLIFFADQTYDPDGPVDKLKLRWSLLSEVAPDPCEIDQKTNALKPQCVARQFSWEPKAEGIYLVQLSATDDADCPPWRSYVFGSEYCNKTAIASVLLRVLAARDPVIVIQPHSSKLASAATLKLDASKSFTFDDQPPKFVWSVDDKRAGLQDTFDVTAPADYDRDSIAVGLVIKDKFGRSKEEKIILSVTKPQAIQSAGVEPADPAKRPSSSSRDICSGGGTYRLTGPLSVKEKGVCRLPTQLVTNGYDLDLQFGQIESASAKIISFETADLTARSGASGSPGAAGAHGRGPGERGEDGRLGTTGEVGDGGRPAGTFRLAADLFTGTLQIDNRAQNGGRGGDGGAGGPGGNGAQGESASSGIFDCRRGPGRGGDGGAGGGGGLGGAAGNGGSSRSVTLQFETVAVSASVSIHARGGLQGDPGGGGIGGQGGRGGPEGPTTGFCGPSGRSGQSGPPGGKGAPGASSVPGAPGTISGYFGKTTLNQIGEVSVSAQ